MLIVLDESLEALVCEESYTDDHCEALQIIATSVKKGNHALTAPYNILEALSNSEKLTSPTKNLYSHIFGKWGQLNALNNLVSKKLVVGSYEDADHPIANGRGDILVDLKFINKHNLLDPTELILEASDDSYIYHFIASSMLEKLGVHTKWKTLNGGGSSIYKEYRSAQNTELDKRLALCIVDPDVTFPGKDIGRTAHSVKKENDTNNPLTDYLVIKVHEAENLIPLSIYQKSYEARNRSNRQAQNLIGDLEAIISKHGNDALLYFDYKNGIKCGDLNSTGNQEFKDYWLPIIDAISPRNAECDYKTCNNDRCNKKILQNWPIMDKTIDHLQCIKRVDLSKEDILYEDWKEISNKIRDWCISYPTHITSYPAHIT